MREEKGRGENSRKTEYIAQWQSRSLLMIRSRVQTPLYSGSGPVLKPKGGKEYIARQKR